MDFDQWLGTSDGRFAFTTATDLHAAVTALRMAFDAGAELGSQQYVEPKEWLMDIPAHERIAEGLFERIGQMFHSGVRES